MKKAILSLTIFSVMLFSVSYLIKSYDTSLVYDHIIFFIIYYYIISLISISLINFAIAKLKGNWMMAYFGSMVVRFFLSLLFAFLFMIFDKPNVMVIGINFVILYLLFLAIDLFIIINKVKKLSSKDQNLNVGQNSK